MNGLSAKAERLGQAPFEWLDHPGDVKLRARGSTLQQLFANAALGMTAYLYGEEILKAQPEQWQPIEVSAPDLEALLVDWLAELLWRSAAERRAYCGFVISALNEHRLAGEVGTVPAEAIDDVKAVTHHELSIRQDNNGWEAIVVFDV